MYTIFFFNQKQSLFGVTIYKKLWRRRCELSTNYVSIIITRLIIQIRAVNNGRVRFQLVARELKFLNFRRNFRDFPTLVISSKKRTNLVKTENIDKQSRTYTRRYTRVCRDLPGDVPSPSIFFSAISSRHTVVIDFGAFLQGTRPEFA